MEVTRGKEGKGGDAGAVKGTAGEREWAVMFKVSTIFFTLFLTDRD